MILIRKIQLLVLLSLAILPAANAQHLLINGRITDPHGKPIPAASIRIKNSSRGTTTDSLGVFSLRAKTGDSLVISAVGFGDTTSLAGNPANIILHNKMTVFPEAVVTGANPNPDSSARLEATREQIITGAFQEYVRSAEFSNGTYHTSAVVANPPPKGSIPYKQANIKMVSTTTNGFGPLNTLNAGTMLPVMTHTEDTRGSRYLLKDFASGVLVDNTGHILTDSFGLLNYDKIDGQLMIAQDAGHYMEVDKEKVIAFALKTPDTSFVFLNVPVLSKINYFVLLANGPRYSIYKSIRTRFLKNNYVSNGLTESGHNYDEYQDTETYFWVDANNNAGLLELKKKSIKSVFARDQSLVDQYFSKHKYDDIDDAFLKGLVNFLNKSH